MEFNLFTIFFAGILLSLTPCVLPVLPLVYRSISSQKNKVASAIIYVLSMSIVYALIGLILAYVGQSLNIQSYVQSQSFNIGIGVFFIILSFSMFDIYHIKIPRVISDRINTFNQNTSTDNYYQIAIIGASSALILSPCITAPLAGILIFISKDGSLFKGFYSLFLLGLGMGLPLIFISLGLHKYIPKNSSMAMIIKYFFGFMLIISGLWFITNSFDASIIKFGFFALLIFYIFVSIITLNLNAIKSMILSLLSYFIFLTFSGIYIWDFTKQNDHSIFTNINNISELEQNIIQSEKEFILLDFYATWCSPCLKMETEIFADTDFISKYTKKINFLQVDITETEQKHKELMSKFSVFGPPSVLIFNKNGEVVQRIDGSIKKNNFSKQLKYILDI